jgi:hypothetical protein
MFLWIQKRLRWLITGSKDRPINWRRGFLLLLCAIGVGLAIGLPKRAAAKREAEQQMLMWAVREGDTKTLRRLFASGVGVNYKCYYDEQPGKIATWLHWIRYRRPMALCGNIVVRTGTPPLMLVTIPSRKMTDFLLEQGADPNVTDDYGTTALHIALYRNEEDTAMLLIRHGAHIEARDRWGETPLMIAREEKNSRMVRLLQQAGARQ